MSELTHFEGRELVVLTINGRRAFTAETVGTALEYAEPLKRIADLHRRNSAELEQGIDWDWWEPQTPQNAVSEKTRYSTRIYYQTGVNLLGMLSEAPKAIAFRRWAKHALAELQETTSDEPAQSEGEIYLRTGRVMFSQKCKICTSPLALDINRLLDEGKRFEDVVAWAAEQGLSISKAGLSRHNAKHRVPQIAERSLLENPEIAARIMLAKLTEIAQRRTLDGLSDREVVKYQTALATALNRDGGGSRGGGGVPPLPALLAP